MNPKNSIIVGVLVLVMVMGMIPLASALSVTQQKLDLLEKTADYETYALTVDANNKLDIIGVKWYTNELAVIEWAGVGHAPVELATYDMTPYTYYPTNAVWFDGLLYISAINWSSPDGNGIWETPLFVYDPGTQDLSVAETFGYGMISQMTNWNDDYLVLLADTNAIIYTDNGVDFTTKLLVADPQTYVQGQSVDYYYFYDILNLGITMMGDDIYVESRNCTWMHDEPQTMMKTGDNKILGPPPTYEHAISDAIEFRQLDDVDNDWNVDVTTHSLSRVELWRSSTYHNFTTPLITMPNGVKFVFTVDNGVFVGDDNLDYYRIYNGDSSLYNPEPISANRLVGNAYAANKVIVNTVNSGDNAPSCPTPIEKPNVGFIREKPQPKQVFQSFGDSVIPLERNAIEIDITTGVNTHIFSNSAQVLWDEKDFIHGSVVIATTTGVFTWHTLVIDLTGAITSLMLALLVVGIVFLVFGIATWNKGLEDILALSIGGSLISGAVLLYFVPAIYLSWLLLFIPLALFFVFMYYIVTTYKVSKLDFHFRSFDSVWIIVIIGVLIAIEIGTAWFTNTFYPGWLPAP